MIKKIPFVLISCLFFSSYVYAADSFFYKEVDLVGGYSTKQHWVGEGGDQVNSVGFEYYKKFSNDYGDFLTADLQMRAAYNSIMNSHEAWGLQIHNAWLMHRLTYGANVRIGHFDPAFGLEPQLDTHSTLLQTLAIEDIGFKKDWGIGLEGALPKFDYKLAFTLGSGMSIWTNYGSYLFTGRIGSPTTENFQYGLSLLYGDTLESDSMNTVPRGKLLVDKAIKKKRVGLDTQYLFGPCLFKGEVAYGENSGQGVLGYMAELDYTFPKYQNLELELQLKSWINDLSNSSSDDSTVTLGLSYKLSQNTTLRSSYSHSFDAMGQKADDKVLFQFYFLGA